ncbi:MAG: sigma-70 family RNA polymerase sigma factor [Deltaproteobacteria bacterium]|nr:sigma-70 family RNA polymerase sigma factor [Deltaproteobacteria bacterium]MBI3390132.1 sigma-70 family RNA polymerase sigma factor [Deltaproteobacteria bacterium]
MPLRRMHWAESPERAVKESESIAIVRRAAAGDHAALAELYDSTSAMVFGLAVRILNDRTAAEDIVVEVYAQAWRSAKAYDPSRGTPSSWLMTLTRSRAIDLLRARRRDQASEPLDAASAVPSAEPEPEDATIAVEQQRFVRRALAGLSVEQREAIELAYFAGLSHTEIAAKLRQPLGTVKTRIRLGMLRLREQLAPLAPGTLAVGKEVGQ